jgi:hypothetical protein
MQNEYKNYWFEWDDFKDMLEERRNKFTTYHADCSDKVFDYFLEAICECGNGGRTPMDLVDNFLVNGDWAPIGEYLGASKLDELKDENGEWDEDKLQKLIEDRGYMTYIIEDDNDVTIINTF